MLHGPALQERAQAPGLFSKDTLEERVMRLMEKNSVLSLRARVARAAAGAAVKAATILLAAVVHVTPVMAAPVTQSAVVQSPVTQSPVADANAAPLPQESPSAAPPTAAAPSASPDPPAAARGDEAGDQATVEQKNESHVHRGPQDDGTLVLDLDTAHCKLTPEERLQIQQQLDDALQQLRDTKDALNHGDLKRQMDDVHGRMADTQAMLSRPEFKKQMEDAARQAKQQAKEFALRGEEFKKQMADLQTKLQSGEFQEQIAAAKRQAADAALHGEEFKKQMQELQQLRSEEFKRAMEQAAQALKDAEEQFKNKSVH
jgi:hypothetical protein